jgi:hypothetical protein
MMKWQRVNHWVTRPARSSEKAQPDQNHDGRCINMDEAKQVVWRVHGRVESFEKDGKEGALKGRGGKKRYEENGSR